MGLIIALWIPKQVPGEGTQETRPCRQKQD
jgi:hypothetical protein